MTSLNECPEYDIKPSDDAPVILDLWKMRNTLSLPWIPCPL